MSITELCEIIPLEGIDREEWLELRKDCLGGSDAGVILGLSKYASPTTLYEEKLGIATREVTGLAAEMGNLLEPTVAFLFARETGLRVVQWNVMLKSKERPWASANVDYWVSDDPCFEEGIVNVWADFDGEIAHEPPGLTAIVECKTSAIVTHGTNHLWDNDAVPETYQAQGAHYCVVTGLRTVWFAALLGGEGFIHRKLEWDEDILEGLAEKEDDFWLNHVAEKIPPPLDGSEATTESVEKRYPSHEEGKKFVGDEHTLELWDEYWAAKELEEVWKKKKQEAKNNIVTLIQDAEFAEVDGKKVFTYRQQKGKKGVDAKKLAEKYPEVYDDVYTEGSPFRALRKGGR